MSSPRIKIFCRSFDLRLYLLSKAFYEKMGYDCVRLTDCSADGYFYRMLRDLDCDIAVNVDEDAFILDTSAVEDLIGAVLEGGYANAGCPDGGNDAMPRDGDPTVTNPFFNVLDLRLIREKFDISLMERRDTDKEPYYPFFRWISKEFKTLYLPAEKHADGFSTILKMPDGRRICQHSWMARFYTMPTFLVHVADPEAERQKERIDALIDESFNARDMQRPEFSKSDILHFTLDRCLRWLIKIPQRISRWPYKIARKIRLSRNN